MKSFIYPFDLVIKKDDEQIKFIQSQRAFSVQPKDGKPPKKEKWNAFNLIPDNDSFPGRPDIAAKFHYEMLCEFATENNPVSYDIFWEEKPLSEVWNKLMRTKAKNY